MNGFDYYSDDVAPIDPVTSRVYPFEKRIALKQSSVLHFFAGLEPGLADGIGWAKELRQRYVRPEDVNAVTGGPAPARWIVFLGPDREGPPRLSSITRAETVERLAEHCFNLFAYGDRGVALLSRAVKEAEARFQLDGGTPIERAALLSERWDQA
jgi:hypothetical protein